MCPGHLQEETCPSLQPTLPLKETRKSVVVTDPPLFWCALPKAGGLGSGRPEAAACRGKMVLRCLSVSNSHSMATREGWVGRQSAGDPLLPSRLVVPGKSYPLGLHKWSYMPRTWEMAVPASWECLGRSCPGCPVKVAVSVVLRWGKPHGGNDMKLLPSVSWPACKSHSYRCHHPVPSRHPALHLCPSEAALGVGRRRLGAWAWP